MKRLLAVLIALIMAVTMFGVLSFAAEEAPVESDPTTFRGYTYDEDASMSPDVWMNIFDADDNCIGTDYVVFNAASAIKGIAIPMFYAGKKENDQDADVRFELFKWDTDAKKTLEGTPVFTEDRNLDGDHPVELQISEPLPAGTYLFNITQLSGRGEWTEGVAHYSVLPLCDLKYSEAYLTYGARGKFAFYVDFEKKDGVEDYFLKLSGDGPELDIQREKTLIARNGDTPHEIMEYAIVTPVIPDGQVLYSVTLSNAPTWSNTNGDSDVEVTVYKWKNDYDDSVEGTVVFETEILDHTDNSNLTVKFNAALRYGNRYLIVFTRSNDGRIGYWQGVDTRPDGWEFYDQGSEVEFNPSMKVTYALCGDLGPEPTEAPTAEPTEKPTAEPATEAPVVTEAPKPTDAPKTTDKPAEPTQAPAGDDTDNKEQKKDNKVLPVVLLAACGLIIVGSVLAIVLSKKKK